MAAPKKQYVVKEETSSTLTNLKEAQNILSRVGTLEKKLKGSVIDEVLKDLQKSMVVKDKDATPEVCGTYILVEESVDESTGEVLEKHLADVGLKSGGGYLTEEEAKQLKAALDPDVFDELFEKIPVLGPIQDMDALIKFIGTCCLDPKSMVKDVTVSDKGIISITPVNNSSIPGVGKKNETGLKKGFLELLGKSLGKIKDIKPIKQWISQNGRITGALKFPAPPKPKQTK
jgi:hypothetical protein